VDGYDYLEGRVMAVIYSNEDNGYTVLKLKTEDGHKITVVGCIPYATVGEDLELYGSVITHNVYGKQFKAERVQRYIPTDSNGLILFLSSGDIKGIGEATAERIVDEFGAECIEVIMNSPDKLCELRGITQKKARDMSERMKNTMALRYLLDFFETSEMRAEVALRLFKRYAQRSLSIVTNNPYILVDEYYGVTFSEADKFAYEIGIDRDSLLRYGAAIKAVLILGIQNGHMYLPEEMLIVHADRYLGESNADRKAEAIELLCNDGEIVRDQIGGQDVCYLSALYDAECAVAEKMYAMSLSKPTKLRDAEDLIAQIEQELGMQYAEKQREAIKAAAENSIMILTGGPGTGKTTTIRAILKMLDLLDMDYVLAAPTGRAAKRMSELCGEEAKTIHRLLEAVMAADGMTQSFNKNSDDKLKLDVLILDEVSMIDMQLFSAVLEALPDHASLIMVGDSDQLPSVGPGDVLKDLERSGVIKTVHLEEIFRQAQQSMIVMNAHAINTGRMPRLERSRDFFFMRRTNSQELINTVIELCKTRLPSYFDIDSSQIQVIMPSKQREVGTYNLNNQLQAALNPGRPGKKEYRFGDTIFREGDRVMQVRNNYDITWRRSDMSEAGWGIFNGDIGTIEAISLEEETIVINFDERIADYSLDLMEDVELAYAITVHKSQGSEFPAVVYIAFDAPSRLLTRNLLYTAVTRARKVLVAVGKEEIIQRMTENNESKKRYSGLKERIMLMAESDKQ